MNQRENGFSDRFSRPAGDGSLKGFTLVELLVAVLLSSLLVIGVISVFITTQRGVEVQDQLVVMGQNNRAGLEILSRDLRMAGLGVDRSANQPGYVDLAPFHVTINADIMAKDDSTSAQQTNKAAIIDPNLLFDLISLREADTNGSATAGCIPRSGAPTDCTVATGKLLPYSARPSDAWAVLTSPAFKAETIRFSFDRNNDYVVDANDADPSFNPWDFVLTRTVNNGIISPDPVAFGVRGVATSLSESNNRILKGGRYPNGSFPTPLFQYLVDEDFNPETPPTLWGDTNGDGTLDLGPTGELATLLANPFAGAVVLDPGQTNIDNNEDDNFNGRLDPGEDINGNGRLDTNLLDQHVEQIIITMTTAARVQDPNYFLESKSQPSCPASPDTFDPASPNPNIRCYRFRESTSKSIVEPRNVESPPLSCGKKPRPPVNVATKIDLCTGVLGETAEASSVPVIITWDPSPDDGAGEEDVVGYVVYRAIDADLDDTPDGTIQRIDFVGALGTPGSGGAFSYSYQDETALVGNQYFYWVTAIDCGSQESVASADVAKRFVVVPQPAPPLVSAYSVVAFDKPGDGSAAAQGIKVEWNAAALTSGSPDDDGSGGPVTPTDPARSGLVDVEVKGYNVYRLTPGQVVSGATPLGTVSPTVPNRTDPGFSPQTVDEPDYCYTDSLAPTNTDFYYAVTTVADVTYGGNTETCESTPRQTLCLVRNTANQLSPPTFHDATNVSNTSGAPDALSMSIEWVASPNERNIDVPAACSLDAPREGECTVNDCIADLTDYFVYRRTESGAYPTFSGGTLIPLYRMRKGIEFTFTDMTDILRSITDEDGARVLPTGNPDTNTYPLLAPDTVYCYTVAAAEVAPGGDPFNNPSDILQVYPDPAQGHSFCEICDSTSINCDCPSISNVRAEVAICEPARARGAVNVAFDVVNPEVGDRFELLRSDSAFGNYTVVNQLTVTQPIFGTKTFIITDDPGTLEVNHTQTDLDADNDGNYYEDTQNDAEDVTFYYRVRCVNTNVTPACQGSITSPDSVSIARPDPPKDVTATFISTSCSDNSPEVGVQWSAAPDCDVQQNPASTEFITLYKVLRKNLISGTEELIGCIPGEKIDPDTGLPNPHYNERNGKFLYVDPADNGPKPECPTAVSTPPLDGVNYAYRVIATGSQLPTGQSSTLTFDSPPSPTSANSQTLVLCSCTPNEALFQDNFNDREPTISNVPCLPEPPATISCINDDDHTNIAVGNTPNHSYPWKETGVTNADSDTNWIYGNDTERGRKSALPSGNCFDINGDPLTGCFGNQDPSEESFPSMTLRNNPEMTFNTATNDFVVLTNDFPPPSFSASDDPGPLADNNSEELNRLENYSIRASLRSDIDRWSAGIVLRYIDDPDVDLNRNFITNSPEDYHYGVAIYFNNPGDNVTFYVYKAEPPDPGQPFKRVVLGKRVHAYSGNTQDFGWYTLSVDVCNTGTAPGQPKITVKFKPGKGWDANQLTDLNFVPLTGSEPICDPPRVVCDTSGSRITPSNDILDDQAPLYLLGKPGFVNGPLQTGSTTGTDQVYIDDVHISQLCNCP